MAEQNKKAVTMESLTRVCGGDKGKADALYTKIANYGGYGDPGVDFVGENRPALDLTGLKESKREHVEKWLVDAEEAAAAAKAAETPEGEAGEGESASASPKKSGGKK
jgi:hypothetical protein